MNVEVGFLFNQQLKTQKLKFGKGIKAGLNRADVEFYKYSQYCGYKYFQIKLIHLSHDESTDIILVPFR